MQVICGSGVSVYIATGLASLATASRRLEEALRTLVSQGLTCIELWQAAPRVEVHSWTALGTGRMRLWCVAAYCYWPGVARHSISTSRGSSGYTGFAGFNVQRVIEGCTRRRGRGRGAYLNCGAYSQVICGSGVSLYITTGLASLGKASRRIEGALRTLASQGLMCIE